MKEKINATSVIHTREDKKRTSVVDVFNVAEVTETLKALQGEREDELQEIHRSWIDSAVDEILKEVKYASYDFIHIPISDVEPYISSVTIDDFVIGMKSSAYAILYNNELSLLPYVTYDKIDVDTSVFMTDATCITKGNNEVVILSSNGQGCKININAYKHGITGATLEEVIQEHGYLQKLFTCPVEPFTDIVFIADRYIAVTGNGKIYKNIENSDNWELVTEYQDKQFTAIASSGNALYCITNDGNSYLSVNYGDDWVNHPMPYPNQYSDITYSEEADTFIACSVNGDYRIAKWDKDSAMWRAFKSSTQHEWQSITSGNGVIVAVGNGVATASYDGEKWYNILIPNHDWTTATRSNYFFYVFSADGHIVRSANGGITGILFATTDEALKGYETGKPVSPFTMHAFIDSLIATSEEAIEGTHQRKIITPYTMHAFIDSLITTSDEAIEGIHQRKIITPYTMHAFIDSLITTSDEAIEGIHQRKIITPYTMHAFINNSLGNVDNTSDIDKPISTATQEALDGKYDKTGGLIKGRVDISPSTSPTQAVTLSMFATDDGHYRNDYFYNGKHIGGVPIRYNPDTDTTSMYLQSYNPNDEARNAYLGIINEPTGNTATFYNTNVSVNGTTVSTKFKTEHGVASPHTSSAGYTFDVDTGMYSKSDGYLNFFSNGVERLTVYGNTTTIHGNLTVTGRLTANGTVTVDTFYNGSSWYRKWSDGWVEQGGTQETTNITYTFLVPFIDTNYTISVGFVIANKGRQGVNKYVHKFETWSHGNNSGTTGGWYACGRWR